MRFAKEKKKKNVITGRGSAYFSCESLSSKKSEPDPFGPMT